MSVETLKTQRSSKQKSFNTYANRRNAVRKIISDIDNKLDDDVRDINNQITKCISEFRSGLCGVNTSIPGRMESEKEKIVDGGEGNLTACKINLSREVNRCQNRINTLDDEIRQLEIQIKAEGGKIYFWE